MGKNGYVHGQNINSVYILPGSLGHQFYTCTKDNLLVCKEATFVCWCYVPQLKMKFMMLHSVYWTGVLRLVLRYIMCESSLKHFSSYATERNHEEKETTAS